MTAEFKNQAEQSKYASVFITQSLLYSGELPANPIPNRKCKAHYTLFQKFFFGPQTQFTETKSSTFGTKIGYGS